MPLTELRLKGRQSRALELYERLRTAIHEGRLRPGERLVEDALAAVAHTSRTPVREALRKLEAEGLVRAAGRGMVVSAPTWDELAELCDVREVLEGMAARRAAESRSETEVAIFERLVDAMRSASRAGDVDALIEGNRRFHEALWRAARNRYLARQLAALRGAIDRLQPTTLHDPHRRAEVAEEHERILRALVDKDPDAAERHARAHFRNGEALRLALGLDRDGAWQAPAASDGEGGAGDP